MRIIFMGTPDIATGTLQALLDAGHEIALVVTQPDKPAGRGKKLMPSPVKILAEAEGLEVFQPVKVRDPEAVSRLREAEADVIVVVAFGQILPQEVLDLTPYGCINVHASLLPAWRGAAPIQWAILNGDQVTGVTTMQMDAGLDTGDILLKREIGITPDETGGSLFDKLAQMGAELCVETLQALQDGSVVPVPQGETTTPYASMLTRKSGEIDWSMPAVQIERMVRGLSPWPGAYSYRSGKRIKICRASLAAAGGEDPAADGGDSAAGELLAGKDSLCVKTGDGQLVIDEVQPEGKRRMTAAEYLRGYPVQPGEKMG